MSNTCVECSEYSAYCAEEMENGREPLGGKERGSDCPHFHLLTPEQREQRMGYYGPNDDYH